MSAPSLQLVSTQPKQVRRAMPLHRLGDLAKAESPHDEHAFDLIVPSRVATLLGGHGGVGKTTFAEMVGAHFVDRRSLAGFKPRGGRAVFVSMEDEPDLVRYRMRLIAESYDLNRKQIENNFLIVDGTEWDDGLAVDSRDGRSIEFTQAMSEVESGSEGVQLIIIDNASDAYLADEIDRKKVRRFMRGLTKIARKRDAGLILLAHIDKDAAKNGARGNSYSGSTAWHNSARSRLALIPCDDGTVELRHEKANLGPKADPVTFRFNRHGILVPVSRTEIDEDFCGGNTAALLECLAAEIKRGGSVSTSRGGSCGTHTHMRNLPEFPAALRQASKFWPVWGRLADAGKIVREDYRNTDRKHRQRWIIAPNAPNAPNADLAH